MATALGATDEASSEEAWGEFQQFLLEGNHYVPTFATTHLWFGRNVAFSVLPGSGLVLDPFSLISGA